MANYKQASDEIYDYWERHWSKDFTCEHFVDAIKALGYKSDGYDEYGSRCYYKDGVRIALYFDRGDYCWCIEQAQGESETTDNFYNTSSEMCDIYGNYGCGDYEDDLNRGAW